MIGIARFAGGAMPTSSLVTQIARSAPLPARLCDMSRAEVRTARIPWTREYGEYQSGGWWTASLLNGSGDPTDVTIADCDPVPTTQLQAMPHTRELLDGLGVTIMWARLAKLSANSFLWEHRDYTELEDVERHRLHIPLETNSSAFLVVGGTAVHLTPGHLWRLTPVHHHGACNLYGPDRTHLVVDCYADDRLTALLAGSDLDGSDLTPLPAADEDVLGRELADAGRLLDLGYDAAAEAHLLQLFFRYALPPGREYDLLTELYGTRGRDGTAQAWAARKRVLLGLPG
jgi:hypothetical protein